MVTRMSSAKFLAMGDKEVGSENPRLLGRARKMLNSSPQPRHEVYKWDLLLDMKERERLGINFNRSVTLSLASRWEVVNKLTVEFLEEVISLNDQLAEESSKHARQLLALILTRTERMSMTSRIEQMAGLLMHVTFYRTVLMAKIGELEESTSFLLLCSELMGFSYPSQIMDRFSALQYTLCEIAEDYEKRVSLLGLLQERHAEILDQAMEENLVLHNTMGKLHTRLNELRSETSELEMYIDEREKQAGEAIVNTARIRESIHHCYSSMMTYRGYENRTNDPFQQVEDLGLRLTTTQSALKMLADQEQAAIRSAKAQQEQEARKERRASKGATTFTSSEPLDHETEESDWDFDRESNKTWNCGCGRDENNANDPAVCDGAGEAFGGMVRIADEGSKHAQAAAESPQQQQQGRQQKWKQQQQQQKQQNKQKQKKQQNQQQHQRQQNEQEQQQYQHRQQQLQHGFIRKAPLKPQRPYRSSFSTFASSYQSLPQASASSSPRSERRTTQSGSLLIPYVRLGKVGQKSLKARQHHSVPPGGFQVSEKYRSILNRVEKHIVASSLARIGSSAQFHSLTPTAGSSFASVDGSHCKREGLTSSSTQLGVYRRTGLTPTGLLSHAEFAGKTGAAVSKNIRKFPETAGVPKVTASVLESGAAGSLVSTARMSERVLRRVSNAERLYYLSPSAPINTASVQEIYSEQEGNWEDGVCTSLLSDQRKVKRTRSSVTAQRTDSSPSSARIADRPEAGLRLKRTGNLLGKGEVCGVGVPAVTLRAALKRLSRSTEVKDSEVLSKTTRCGDRGVNAPAYHRDGLPAIQHQPTIQTSRPVKLQPIRAKSKETDYADKSLERAATGSKNLLKTRTSRPKRWPDTRCMRYQPYHPTFRRSNLPSKQQHQTGPPRCSDMKGITKISSRDSAVSKSVAPRCRDIGYVRSLCNRRNLKQNCLAILAAVKLGSSRPGGQLPTD